MISIRDEGAVRRITLCTPARCNALGVDDYEKLANALAPESFGPELAVIRIDAEGTVFCAGNDLTEFATHWPQPPQGPVERFFGALATVALPIVAAVQGGAVGVGATLLLHCDLVVLTDTAFLRYPFTALGIAPEGGASRLLPARVGLARASEILVTARRVGAEEALALGLASRVVSGDALDASVRELCAHYTGERRTSQRVTRDLLRRDGTSPLDLLFADEIRSINELIVASRDGVTSTSSSPPE